MDTLKTHFRLIIAAWGTLFAAHRMMLSGERRLLPDYLRLVKNCWRLVFMSHVQTLRYLRAWPALHGLGATNHGE